MKPIPRRSTNQPVRVLVIDDDDITRETMLDLLACAGYEVFSLPSPIGATQRLLQDSIDVVVLDILMPSLRGDKLAVLLRKHPRLQHLGVILVSGASPAQLQRLAAEVSANAILEKADLDTKLVAAVQRAAEKGALHS